MEFRLTLILLVYVLPVTTLPMTLYNMARFDPTTVTSQLVNSFPISGVVTCMCQCYNNSLCITGNYFATNQSCVLYSAYLSQGQLRVVNNVPATVFSFPNRTTITNSVSQPSIIQWLFDGNLNDVYGRCNGYLMNNSAAAGSTQTSNPLWISPGYAGYGSAIYLPSNIYVAVDQYLNLTSVSFTISSWIWIPFDLLPTALEYFFLFAHCENASPNKCMYLGLYFGRLYMTLTGSFLWGTTTINSYQWYHVTYVYDQSTSLQKVYINGVLDGGQTNINPYQGNASKITLGAVPDLSWLSARNGYIDKLTYVSRVKSDSELLDEATLVAYYPFDNSYLDAGPNSINNITNVSTSFDAAGHLGQALLIGTMSISYLQTTGFYYLGQSNYSYSFSLWIYPFTNRGTILQVSSSNNWCMPMIGFNSSQFLTIQTIGVNGVYSITMPYQIPLSVWSHVSMTYSLTSGIRLYFNGIAFYNGYSGTYSDYTASSQMTTITIGNGLLPSACTSSQTKIYPAQFQGKIDELKIFSRELSATEVYQLFHT